MQNKKITITQHSFTELEEFHAVLTRESVPHVVAVGEISISYAVRVALIIGICELNEISEIDWTLYESAGNREAPPIALNVRAPQWLWERVHQIGEGLGSPSMRASFRAALALGLGGA